MLDGAMPIVITMVSEFAPAKYVAKRSRPCLADSPWDGRQRPWREADVDLLFVADDEAVNKINAKSSDEPFLKMKELIREGKIIFYTLKLRSELDDAGLEDFIDLIGIPFLGACR